MPMPDLAFNPARTYNLINYRYQYAIGNTPASDLSEECVLSPNPEFLSIGCGDIRNVVFTVAQLAKLNAKPNSLHFHLNDVDDLMLARDAVLIQIVNTIDANNKEDLEFLWSVWYNAHLTKTQNQKLRFIIRDFLETPNSCVKYGSSDCEKTLKRLFKLWLKASISMKELNKSRQEFFVKRQSRGQTMTFETACVNMAQTEITSVLTVKADVMQNLTELTNYYKYGSSFPIAVHASLTENVDETMYPKLTLFCPIVQGWRVHPGSSPFACYNKELFDVQKTLRENCMAQMQDQVIHLQRFKQSGGALMITFWTGDGLTLCNYHLPESQLFDFINTSNIIDTVGLMNVLISCGKRLKQTAGILVTQTFTWWRSRDRPKSIMEYVDEQLDIPANLYPTVFGVMLVDDLKVGNTTVPRMGCHVGADEITLKWVRAFQPSEKINISESPELLNGFSKIAKRCLSTFHKDVDICDVYSGLLLHTPSTLVCLIRNMGERIKGGVQILITIAEQYLETQTPSAGDSLKQLEVESSSTGNSFKPLEPESASSYDSFKPLEAEWKMLLQIHLDGYTEYGTNYQPVTVEVPSSLQFGNLRAGSDVYVRGRIIVGSKFYVTTTLEYDYVKETFTLLLPRCILDVYGRRPMFRPSYDNGQVMTILGVSLPQQSNPYEPKCSLQLKDDASHFLDVIESVGGYEIKVSESKDHLWKVVGFKTSDLTKANIMEVFLEEKSDNKEKTLQCNLPCYVTPTGKLVGKEESRYIKLKKVDHLENQDLLTLRQIEVRDLEACTIHEDKVTILINLMLGSPDVNSPGETCTLQELLREVMITALNSSLERNSDKDVSICIAKLDERGSAPGSSLLGYHPEDTMIAVRGIRQQDGKPLVDIVWFDFTFLVLGVMGDPEYVLAQMGLQVRQSQYHSVSRETAWQLKRLLRLNSRRTIQHKLESKPEWYFDGYLQAVYPFYTKSYQMKEKLKSCGIDFQLRTTCGDNQRNKDTKQNPSIDDCCVVCGLSGFTVKRCSACKKVSYCGKICQRKDWKRGHRNTCQKSKD